MKHLLLATLISLSFSLLAQNDEAVHYEKLQKAIDIEIDGYKAGDLEGTSVSYNNASYSVANVRFTNDAGNYIEITLMDYSTAMDIYAATTMTWSMGFKLDSSEEMAGGVEVPENLKGWESFKKKTGVVALTLGAKEKYILVIEMDGQTNTKKAKGIAKKVKISMLP